MAISYTGTTIGTIVIKQDDRRFKLQIRQSNCLMCIINVYKTEEQKRTRKGCMHQLMGFFIDEDHLKRYLKEHAFSSMFYGSVEKIELNSYYKDAQRIIKMFLRYPIDFNVIYRKPQTDEKV